MAVSGLLRAELFEVHVIERVVLWVSEIHGSVLHVGNVDDRLAREVVARASARARFNAARHRLDITEFVNGAKKEGETERLA